MRTCKALIPDNTKLAIPYCKHWQNVYSFLETFWEKDFYYFSSGYKLQTDRNTLMICLAGKTGSAVKTFMPPQLYS